MTNPCTETDWNAGGATLEPYPELTWEAVLQRRRETEPWTADRLVLDSLGPIDENVARALEYVTKGAVR